MLPKNDSLSSGFFPGLSLHKDETLIWAGRPRYGLEFRRIDLFLIPACLVLFSLPIGIISFIARADRHPVVYLILAPFFVLSLLPPLARVLFDSWRRKKTTYAITDQRVIIQTTLSEKTVHAYNVHKINHPKLEVKKDKSGSILFGKEEPRVPGFKIRVNTMPETLESIDDAEAVYKTLLEVRK